MTIDTSGTSGTPPSDVEQRARQDASGAADKVHHDLDAVTQQASEDAKALKREAKAQIGDATDKAKSFATDQKDLAAAQITGVASAISRVADELEGDQATTARYARELAGGLDRFGKTVEGKSVDDLMGMAQQFGRSQPLAFLGAAALAGFVASRFAVASAHRSGTQTTTSAPRPTPAPSANYGSQTNPGASQGAGYGQSPTTPSSQGTGYTGGNGNVTGQ